MQRVRVFGDSELVVRQTQGKYKINNHVLREIHERVQQLKGHFEEFSIEHVLREENATADKLSNEAIDNRWLQGLRGADGVAYDLAACDEVVALVRRAQGA